MFFQAGEIKKTIETLFLNQLFEVRIIGDKTYSGYFNDSDTLSQQLSALNVDPKANIYITLNDIKAECFDREQKNKFLSRCKATTSDRDIEGYQWIMIDLDPKRASGTSSTNEQLEKARGKAREIYKYLKAKNWHDPIVAESGNGIHLLYMVQFSNTPQNVEIVKNFLAGLDLLFSDEDIEVDKKTYNPARITKLYGTVSHKGTETAERPHRLSRIISIPSVVSINDIKLLEEIASVIPKAETPNKHNHYNDYRSFDLEEWLNKYGLNYKAESCSIGTKYILEACPFDSNHKGKDAVIFKGQNGAISFNCFHSSCADKKWRDVRLLFEPDAYENKKEYNYTPNYKKKEYTPIFEPLDDKGSNAPKFLTINDIDNLPNPREEFIRSGIGEIDRNLGGLRKGVVSLFSGLRASGKSSFISQLCIEATEQGFKSAIYSGELMPKDFLRWVTLQTAGADNVEATQFENVYKVKVNPLQKIKNWLNDSIYLYNNAYGNEFPRLIKDLKECIETYKVDLIIIDNLMTLDIRELDYDKYQAQSVCVQELCNIAKMCNVHVLFVAHPRKAQSFLRLEDVSGSNDIVNRVDNAFIMHRVNVDFKKKFSEAFKGESKILIKEDLDEVSNVIEIAKDRAYGTQDKFIPLYFEKESKRLRNSRYENKLYHWDNYIDEEKYLESLLDSIGANG